MLIKIMVGGEKTLLSVDFLTSLFACLFDVFTHAVKLGVQLSSKYSMGRVL